MTSLSLLRGGYPRQVLSVTRVDLEDVALIDEQRHLNLIASLQHRWLESAGDGVASNAGVALHHAKVDRVRQRHADRFAVVEKDGRVDVLLEKASLLTENLFIDEG